MPTDHIPLLIQEWERAKLGAQDYIDAMPDDKIGFRPVPEILAFAGQFLHVADANGMFASAAFGTGVPTHGEHSEDKPELQSKTAMREFALASYDKIINGIKGLTPDALDDEVQFLNSPCRAISCSRKRWNTTLITAARLPFTSGCRG